MILLILRYSNFKASFCLVSNVMHHKMKRIISKVHKFVTSSKGMGISSCSQTVGTLYHTLHKALDFKSEVSMKDCFNCKGYASSTARGTALTVSGMLPT